MMSKRLLSRTHEKPLDRATKNDLQRDRFLLGIRAIDYDQTRSIPIGNTRDRLLLGIRAIDSYWEYALDSYWEYAPSIPIGNTICTDVYANFVLGENWQYMRLYTRAIPKILLIKKSCCSEGKESEIAVRYVGNETMRERARLSPSVQKNRKNRLSLSNRINRPKPHSRVKRFQKHTLRITKPSSSHRSLALSKPGQNSKIFHKWEKLDPLHTVASFRTNAKKSPSPTIAYA